jgi:predicted methyltransferase
VARTCFGLVGADVYCAAMKIATVTFISAILFAAVACTGSSDKPTGETTQQPPQPEQPVAQPPAPDPAEVEKQKQAEKEAEERRQRAAEAMEEVEKEAEAEKARWTEEMHAKAAKLVETDYKDLKAAFKAILASPHRQPGNADRDKYRHPAETLTFFGIRPDMTVIEVGAGGGWYTEILAPLLAKKGTLIVTGGDPNGPADQMSTVRGTSLKLFLENAPELYGKVKVSYIAPPDKLELAPEGTADLAVVIREMHNWTRRDYLDAYLAAIHKALKPGGVLGVVAHRAKPDVDPKESAEKGYLPEEWLIQTVEKAGFKLVEKSEINANPKDTKDYEQGVWTLPPNLALGDKDREKYVAIGESDRMTLKFVKAEAETK